MHLVNLGYETRAAELHPLHWLNGRSAELLRPESDRTLCIKRFKPDWKPDEVRAWAEIYEKFASWLASDSTLSGLTELAPLIETGRDYVIRRFISLPVASADLVKLPQGMPAEWKSLGSAVSGALSSLEGALRGNAVLAEVARLTLLEPSNGTFWQPMGKRWIVAEPKFGRKEVTTWLAAA